MARGHKSDLGKLWHQIRLVDKQLASQSSPKGKDSGKDSNDVGKQLAQNPWRQIPVVVGKCWQADLDSCREVLADIEQNVSKHGLSRPSIRRRDNGTRQP